MNNFWPIQAHQTDQTVGTISSYFGPRPSPIDGSVDNHKGIDIIAPVRWPIHCPENGEVTAVNNVGHDIYGKFFVMITKSNFRLNFWHMNDVSVSVGEKVRAGQVVGEVGDTGNTTGPHLHLQCCMANSPPRVAFDPLNVYFDMFAVPTGRQIVPPRFRAIKTELQNAKASLDNVAGFIDNMGHNI